MNGITMQGNIAHPGNSVLQLKSMNQNQKDLIGRLIKLIEKQRRDLDRRDNDIKNLESIIDDRNERINGLNSALSRYQKDSVINDHVAQPPRRLRRPDWQERPW